MHTSDFFGPIPKLLKVSNPINKNERDLPFSGQVIEYFNGNIRDQATWSHDYIAYVPTGIFRESSYDGDLYHYTKGDNFKNILSSQQLWGSKIGEMNDHSEISYTKDLFLIQISNVLNGHSNSKEIIKQIKLAYDNYICKNIFSVSLSKRANLLSQWNRYSDCSGVSIGFSREVLTAARHHGWEMVEVEYDQNTQINILHEIAKNFFKEDVYSMTTSDFDKWFCNICKDSLNFFSVKFKHPGFSEESEVRLVKDGALFPCDIRKHPSGSRDYIPIDLQKGFNTCDSDLIIRYLFASPSKKPKPRMKYVYSILKQTQTKFIAVVNSGISYSWPKN